MGLLKYVWDSYKSMGLLKVGHPCLGLLKVDGTPKLQCSQIFQSIDGFVEQKYYSSLNWNIRYNIVCVSSMKFHSAVNVQY